MYIWSTERTHGRIIPENIVLLEQSRAAEQIYITHTQYPFPHFHKCLYSSVSSDIYIYARRSACRKWMRNVIWHRGKELFSVGKQLSSKMRATDQTQYPFLYQCQLGVFGYNSPCVSLSVCVDVAIAIERANRANEEGALRTYSTCTTNKYLCPPIVQYCMKMFSG